MKEFFRKMNAWCVNFMYGRNGLDDYNKFLLIIGLIVDMLSMIFAGMFFLIFSDIIFIYVLFRAFSKNLVKRSMENQSYLYVKNWLRHKWKAAHSNAKDKEHRYYVCPQCHQIVRVPRGRGKLDITCPTCGKEFSRKS
jgi:hypothetical protein